MSNTIDYASPRAKLKAIYSDEDYSDRVNAYIDSVIAAAGVLADDTDADKATKVAKYISKHYVYNFNKSYDNYLNGTSFWTTLTTQGISFCTPDACLFKGCMDHLGIPCRYIEGEQNGFHAWNSVLINDQWSEVDVAFARSARLKNRYILFESGRKTYMVVE